MQNKFGNPEFFAYLCIKKEMNMAKKKLIVVAQVTNEKIKSAEQVLIDNGIDKYEADAVLQAIGYVLLDTELYGNEEADKIHNDEAMKKFWKYEL